MEKVYNMYGQIGNLRRQRETIRKNHKEILEIKMRVLGNKNGLICTLDKTGKKITRLENKSIETSQTEIDRRN